MAHPARRRGRASWSARALVLALGPVFAAACEIAVGDPLPGFGAPCVVAEGGCDIEHTCRPEAPGAEVGVCAPVASFGACDEAIRVSHPPGRRGQLKEATVIEIDGPEDFALLEDVRAVTGQVRLFLPGAGDALVGDLCGLRTLQKTGDGLQVSDSDITSLDGLQSFTSATRGLAIFDNRELTDLDGLLNLVHVTPREVSTFSRFDVLIAGNPSLGDAAVDAFVAALATRMGRGLDVIACNNGGRSCDAAQGQLVSFLIANGLPVDR
jgi:hypothetical protein